MRILYSSNCPLLEAMAFPLSTSTSYLWELLIPSRLPKFLTSLGSSSLMSHSLMTWSSLLLNSRNCPSC